MRKLGTMACVVACVTWDHAGQLTRPDHPSLITMGFKWEKGKTLNTYVVLWAGHLVQVLGV